MSTTIGSTSSRSMRGTRKRRSGSRNRRRFRAPVSAPRVATARSRHSAIRSRTAGPRMVKQLMRPRQRRISVNPQAVREYAWYFVPKFDPLPPCHTQPERQGLASWTLRGTQPCHSYKWGKENTTRNTVFDYLFLICIDLSTIIDITSAR